MLAGSELDAGSKMSHYFYDRIGQMHDDRRRMAEYRRSVVGAIDLSDHRWFR